MGLKTTTREYPFPRKRFWTTVVLISSLSVFFIINLIGTNLFLYTKIGKDDYIIASSRGAIHLAVAEHYDKQEVQFEGFEEIYNEIFHIGPFNLFTEKRLDPMLLFEFNASGGPFYASLDLPILFLKLALVGFLFLLLTFTISKRNGHSEPERSSFENEIET